MSFTCQNVYTKNLESKVKEIQEKYFSKSGPSPYYELAGEKIGSILS